MLNFLKKRWIYHSLTWVVIFLLFAIVGYASVQEETTFGFAFLSYLSFLWLCIPITYINYFVKARLFAKRQYLIYALSVPFQLALGVLMYELNENLIFGLFKIGEQPWPQHLSNVALILFTSTGFQYLKRGVVGQYQLQELRAKTTEMELSALRTQLNPHFLFNTLNNIYATIRLSPDRGAEMVMELSEVMRYHLHFSKMKKVPLGDEIKLAVAYVGLEKLRLSENCEVQLDVKEADESLEIAPLLLLPFLENAFKHGTHSTKTSFVYVRVYTEEENIFFEIRNSIFKDKKVVRTQVGQENTRRRLILLYPGTHSLEAGEQNGIYVVKMHIRGAKA